MDGDALVRLNPYLRGIYAPVAREVEADAPAVIGELPKDLNGTYVRNGPNPAHTPSGLHHWFDGEGMAHAIRFEGGRASYRNRFIRTRDFGDDAMPGLFAPARTEPGRTTVYKDTANTDLIFHNGRLLALWYVSGRPVALDPDTLDTIGEADFGGVYRGNVSAHSKVDPETGEFVFFDYALYEPVMRLGVVSSDGLLTGLADITLPGPRLPHDMGLTRNYAILHDLPVGFTPEAMRRRVWSIAFADRPTRFGVTPRPTSVGGEASPRWFEFPPAYIYHVINAWEEGDEVVMAACKMVPNGFTPDIEAHGPYAAMATVLALRAQPYLFRMNMRTGGAREDRIDSALSEFPVVNAAFTGRRTRYSYHVEMDACVEQRFCALLKYDLTTGARTRFAFPPGVFGSEPAFAPRDGAVAEDDGYVVTFVTNAASGASEALVLDAQDFAAPPLARVMLPQRVPAGFHGVWAPAA